MTPLILSQEAEAGDELAATIILETARYLGVGVVSLMHTIDPAIVVIGGAMTWGGTHGHGSQLLKAVRDEVLSGFPPAEQTKLTTPRWEAMRLFRRRGPGPTRSPQGLR